MIRDLFESIPRCRPRMLFRIRIALYSIFPSLGLAYRGGHARHTKPERPLSVSTLKVAAIVAVTVLVAITLFFSLTVFARNSKPGDHLYSIKRTWGNLKLSFARGAESKASENLKLAQTRLVELDGLIESNKLKHDYIESVTEDLELRVDAVVNILQQEEGLENEREIAGQLKNIKSQKENMLRRLAASAEVEEVLDRAGSAQVTLSDTSGQSLLGKGKSSLTGTTNSKGEFEFSANIKDEETARALEVRIDLEERKEVLPLFDDEKENKKEYDSLFVEITPQISRLYINQPQTFTLSATDSEANPLKDRQVMLFDKSSSSTINGKRGKVFLPTDSEGKCDFTLIKTSSSALSRIHVQVTDGGQHDFGECLVLGCVEPPRSGKEGSTFVKATTTPSSNNAERILLDNGIVSLLADGCKPGMVLNNISREGKGKTGALVDHQMLEGKRIFGPRLTIANNTSASYEIAFELPIENGSLRKTYQVTLSQGNSYAEIRARLEITGGPQAKQTGKPALQNGLELEVPKGAKVQFADEAQRLQEKADAVTTVEFKVGNPYALYETNGGSVVVLACPIDSCTYPYSWFIEGNQLGFKVLKTHSDIRNQDGFKCLLGITDKEGVNDIVDKARKGIGHAMLESEDSQEATGEFLIKVEPDLESIKKGNNLIRITVYKNYQTLLHRIDQI